MRHQGSRLQGSRLLPCVKAWMLAFLAGLCASGEAPAAEPLSLPSMSKVGLRELYFYKDSDAVTVTLPAATGGTPPLTYTIEESGGIAMPAGLVFNAATGTLSGTPTTLLEHRTAFHYKVTDSAGKALGSTFYLRVIPPTLNISQTISMDEGGHDLLALSLPGKPGGPVTVTVTSSNSAKVSASPTTFAFNQNTWTYAQTIDVVAHAGDHNATETLTLDAAGGGYTKTGIASVSVYVKDKENPVSVTPSVPASPSLLLISTGPGQVTLRGTANVLDPIITKWEYRYKTSGSYGSWTTIASHSGKHPPPFVVTGLTNGTAYTFQVRTNGSSSSSSELTATPNETVSNRAPVVASAISDQTVAAGATATVAVGSVFSDPDGDALTLSASSGSAGTATVSLSGTTLSIAGVAAGTATIFVTATDPGGLRISDSFVVTVTNRAPVVANAIADQTVAAGATATVALGSVFSDLDGDALTLSASSGSPSTATVSLSGTTLSISGVAAGTSTVTVTATDPGGLQVSDAFVVTVPNRAPAVASAIADQTVAAGATATVALGSVFSDPDGDALTLSASSGSPATATVSLSGTTLSISGVAAGTSTVTVTATDPGGLQVSDAFVVTVPNRAPAVASAISDQTVAVDATATVAVGSVFSDPDGDALTLSASSSSTGTATVSLSGTTLSLTGVAAGTATVTVTATDSAIRMGTL